MAAGLKTLTQAIDLCGGNLSRGALDANEISRADGARRLVVAAPFDPQRRAVDELRSRGEIISDDFLIHVAPLGWEHIAFNGDYAWPAEPLANAFRP